MRSEIEAKIEGLKIDLDYIVHGALGSREVLSLLMTYAPGMGTGYIAYSTAKNAIEALIAKAEAELAALPEESSLARLKREHDELGVSHATDAYIEALEKCRPWVIRNKHAGHLLVPLLSTTRTFAMFPCRASAESYLSKHVTTDGWEIVQWEGNQ